MVVGQSGLGKSTFINTLFATKIAEVAPPVEKTTSIKTSTVVLEENNVKMALTLVDTPGFHDALDNTQALGPILSYIEEQNRLFLTNEFVSLQSRASDGSMGYDSRIHLVLYFVAPECVKRGLSDMDKMSMKALGQMACLLPIIAKSDTLTVEERTGAKQKVQFDLESEHIRFFPYELTVDQLSGVPLGADEERYLSQVRDMVPFCIVGGDQVVGVATVNGQQKAVRGRKMRGGFIDGTFGGLRGLFCTVEDPTHCDTPALVHFVTRTHLADLLDTTSFVHYQAYRNRMLGAISFASILGDAKFPTVPRTSRAEIDQLDEIPMPTVAAPAEPPSVSV